MPMNPEPNSPTDEVVEALRQRDVLRLLKALASQQRAPADIGRARPGPAPAPVVRAPRRKPQPEETAPGSVHPLRDGLSPGEVPRSSSGFWLWVVLALLAWLGFRYWGG